MGKNTIKLTRSTKMIYSLLFWLLLPSGLVNAQNHIELYDNGNKRAVGFKDKAGIAYGH